MCYNDLCFDRTEDIATISKIREVEYCDPEKWWSEQHVKTRIWEQWAIDTILDRLINASPLQSTMDILFDMYDELNYKLIRLCSKNEQHSMYVYAKKTIFLVAERICDEDDIYFLRLLKECKEEEYNYE